MHCRKLELNIDGKYWIPTNDAIENARGKTLKYTPVLLSNGDILKQLLARSRYLLFKSSNKWTENQAKRAEILFKRYPDLKKAYGLCQKPILDIQQHKRQDLRADTLSEMG
ncbi:transposase [Maribacter ulvicola]|uniref:Transposase n=1 Tax=Maribacter ulvicola TaxID=228959 RepID=A0A1N6QGH7_9FLAO|nr:transposase [Maribacter ulvicola]SIQ15466.1 Transposase [Maribacter ulvicola]